jgi:ATP-dependent Zn protease
MASVPAPAPASTQLITESHAVLSNELRRLTRAASAVALLTSPVLFYWFYHHEGWTFWKSLFITALTVVVFRGLVDILVRRVIPWPSLFGTEDARLREEDITNRRRAWTWRFWLKLAILVGGLITVVFVIKLLFVAPAGSTVTWTGTAASIYHSITNIFNNPNNRVLLFQIPIFFLANFLIFMGPLMLMGVSQIRGYEPGDAEWGVKLDHVRGQAEAKEEIRRVVTLWQSGEVFEGAGGKRERGLLFLGPPGTGKTMMAKAIATGFNSPFVSIPGSGFAQTFIGIDAVIVRFLARKAKKLARKWGGQCIVFIDEIDAVGMRRQSLAGAPGSYGNPNYGNPLTDWTRPYYGPMGAINPSGDIIIESAAWRDYIFESRAPERRSPYPPFVQKIGNIVHQGIFPGLGGMGGGLALNQLLVVMDGIDNPPFFKRVFTNKTNAFLDAVYFVPRRVGRVWGILLSVLFTIGACALLVESIFALSGYSSFIAPAWILWKILFIVFELSLIYLGIEGIRGVAKSGTLSLRIPRAKPTGAQIYFIGATNVPVTNLDPALTRPGRMGRHIHFRPPTKEDRKDVFDLYLEKVAHDPDLDTPERRDEIARITSGYSPAMIDQICSMALTNAHHEGQAVFNWHHLVDAMTVIETGTAINVKYTEADARAVAIHEAGHAAAAHVYVPEVESSRLSIKMRGASLGHHQSFEKEERFGAFQSRMFGELVHAVGAMAAELVFFGENSVGVGGDLQSTSWTASGMVGGAGMSPLPLELNGKTFADETEEQTRERVNRRLEDIGNRLMNKTSDGWQSLADPRKRMYAAQFIGEAFVTAYNLIRLNKEAVERIADKVLDEKEIYGDDLVKYLNQQNFQKPVIDWTDEDYWPKFMNWSRVPTGNGNGNGPEKDAESAEPRMNA